MKKEIWILAIIFVLFLVSFKFDDLIVLSFNSIGKNFQTSFLSGTLFWWIFVLVLSSIILFINRKSRRYIPLLWASFLMSLIITWLLKYLITRPRPYEVLELTSSIIKSGYSFPSGHATSAFAVIPFLSKASSKFTYIWLIFVIIFIVFLRVSFGLHYLSDILASFLIGYGVSVLLLYFKEKYRFLKF